MTNDQGRKYGRRTSRATLGLCALAIGHWSLVISLHAGPNAPAGGELSLTLHRAIELSLAKNYVLRAAAYGPVIAAARLRAAEGRALDPTAFARGQRSKNNNPVLADPNSGLSGTATQSTTDAFSAGVEFPTGLGSTISVNTNTQNRTGDFNRDRDEWNSFAGLSMTQPLLRGFGPAAALAPIRVARLDRTVSGFAYRQSVMDTVTEVVQAYADVLFAVGAEDVARRSRDLASRLLNDNERRVRIGVLVPLDISTARAQLAAREEAAIASHQAVREAENALKIRVTDDVARLLDVRLVVAPLTENPPEADLRLAADLRSAFARRPDYQQSLLDLQRRQVDLRFLNNAAGPQLDLIASLGAAGLSRDLAESLSQTGRAQNVGYTFGLNFSVPIPNRAARGDLDAGRLGIAQALLSLKSLEQSIVVRLDNAAGAVRDGRARVRAATESVRLARESLAAEESKLGVGTSTTYTVLLLQNDLATAENTRLRALTDYRKAVAEYDRQSGRTLERHAVQVLP